MRKKVENIFRENEKNLENLIGDLEKVLERGKKIFGNGIKNPYLSAS